VTMTTAAARADHTRAGQDLRVSELGMEGDGRSSVGVEREDRS
jgi:hypothetical protein